VAALGVLTSGCASVNRSGSTTGAGIVIPSTTAAGSPTTSARVAPVDAAYVAGFCAAILVASTAAGKVAPSGPSTAQDYKTLAPVYSKVASAVAKLQPPSDAVATNDLIVNGLNEVADSLASGAQNRDPFGSLENIRFPAATGARLQTAASQSPVCTRSGTRFDDNPLA
jgi:hypothetical protein